MKRLLIVLSALLMAGCASTRSRLPLAERVTHDTLNLSTVRFDSIYICQERFQERSHDTVYRTETRVEYRYCFVHDTLRLHQVDSIPVIREVEVVREVTRTPWYMKALAGLGMLSAGLWILRIKRFNF